MKSISLYGSDFRNNADNGESLFNLVLEKLEIDPSKWDDITSITFDVDETKVEID